ncbi:histidine-containing phosphotransfer protein 1-like isoform X1 [Silene latifolia]|uniref:histidine-containing phosphotransfer protein 1-like isoform X1 n=1 Tax=Silene latifolia TaxID=37657 RepID=UPI003D77CA3A
MGSGTAHQLQKHLIDYTASLFNEGILNEQFTQLQSLQDESNPDFVGEVVNLFFEDSERLLNEMAKSLGQGNVDFKKLDAHVHQLKGSSSSIGAQRVQNSCISFRNCCDEKNVEGCVKCLQQVRNEYSLVKSKLETMFKLEQQILAAGASIPKVVSGF